MELALHLDITKKYGIAVSGGVDSMVLLHLCYQHGIKDAVVITIDHGIREESQQEVEAVARIAKSYGYDSIISHVDCPTYAIEHKMSVELAGRAIRYSVFDQVQKDCQLDYVLLAHHLDDQIETMMMRILRGTGVAGLRGIVDRGFYLHPLKEYPKSAITAYATAHNLAYYEDRTNADNVYRRNAIRNSILPTIAEEYPSYRASFLRLANAADETEDYLDSCLVGHVDCGDYVCFALDIFDVHKAIFKRSIRKAIRVKFGIMQDFEERHFDALLALRDKPVGTSVMLGQQLIARIDREGLVLEKECIEEQYERVFSPADVISWQGNVYSFEQAESIERGITLDLDKVPTSAVVRTRQDGDLFKRCNGKTKLLSDYLTDAKLSLRDKRGILLLADGNIILAILGMEIADCVKIDEHTTRILKIVKKPQLL